MFIRQWTLKGTKDNIKIFKAILENDKGRPKVKLEEDLSWIVQRYNDEEEPKADSNKAATQSLPYGTLNQQKIIWGKELINLWKEYRIIKNLNPK